FDKAYYLGPEKGADRAYRLLSEAMRATGRTALARYAARGKQYLVQLRPIEGGGLVMQQLMYADEVRPFSEVEVPQGEVKPAEREAAPVEEGRKPAKRAPRAAGAAKASRK